VRAHQLSEGELIARLCTSHQERNPVPLNHLTGLYRTDPLCEAKV
jgi:hypothetical protein